MSVVGQVVTEAMLYAASASVAFAAGVKVHKLIRISSVTAGDEAFARQIRRKIL